MEMAKRIKCGGETVTIRPYDHDKDNDKVLKLWNCVFKNKMPFSLWQWKYLQNPYETAILICENENNMPVVLYGGIPFISNVDGKTGVMIHLSDIMSHPDYRGSGLFIHTANAYFDVFGSRETTTLMYGFPGSYHFDIGAKYLSYSSIGNGAAFLRANCDTLKKHCHLFSGKTVPFVDSDPCMDLLWQQCKKHYPLSIARNQSFIKWRFFDHPVNVYEVWGWFPGSSQKDNLQALAVLKIQGKKAVILDMVALKSHESVQGFLGKMAENLLEKGISEIETWFPESHFLTFLFQECGFHKKKEPLGIIPTVRIFDDFLAYDRVCENMYYTMADGDLF